MSRSVKRRWTKPAGIAVLASRRLATRRYGGTRAAVGGARRSRSRSCRTARAPSARSTTRISPASSRRCRSSQAGTQRTRTSRATAGSGASINGHPLQLVGVGCGNDSADKAISETKRLMEQLGADIMIGPLSGDESIAIANYAKQHPTKTFVDGAAGAQDTTLKVRAPNFFRFNGDGAQWNAGLGDLAYNKLGWKTAAVVADDYSLRLDVGGGLHRRVLRGRRQRDEAGVPAARTRPTTRRTRSRCRRTSTAPSWRSEARA